ncbi:MAG: DUF4230 domain-containing protein [Spirochaetaceae bacterium]
MSRLPIVAALPCIFILLGSCSPRPNTDVSQLERRITHLLRLHSYEHVYRDIVYFGEERSFLFFKTMDRALLFSVDIVVRAGVDLEQGVDLTLDRGNPERIIVQLPPTCILQIDTDESSIHQYFSRSRGGNVGWLEYGTQLQEVKERVRQDALDRGILTKAEDNVRGITRNFFALSGFEEVVFRPAGSPRPSDGRIQG